jgi:hypothetical protein
MSITDEKEKNGMRKIASLIAAAVLLPFSPCPHPRRIMALCHPDALMAKQDRNPINRDTLWAYALRRTVQAAN